MHPAFWVSSVSLQSSLVDNALLRERLLAVLSAFFGGIGLLLAAVGLYGVLSYAVVQRTREIGIRLALGAPRAAVVRAMLARVGAMATIGSVVGIGGGLVHQILSPVQQAFHLIGLAQDGVPAGLLLRGHRPDAWAVSAGAGGSGQLDDLAGLASLRTGGVPRLIDRTLEVRGLRKDGSEVPLEISLSTWCSDDGT